VTTRRILKILHELSSFGVTGALAAHMILLAVAPTDSPEGYVATRQGIEAISGWLLVPSLVVALVSGLFAMAIHAPFHNAGWAWAKLLLGLPLFEGILATIDSSARRATVFAIEIAEGGGDPDKLEKLVAAEWRSLAFIMTLAVAQTVLGVWRPRKRRRRRKAES
jgi:hypothetical protein